MAEPLTRDEVLRIAALANLELDEGEIDLFARQLADVLAYAKEVRRIDTSGVPPTASVLTALDADAAPHAGERDDVQRAGLDRDSALAGAPDAAGPAGLFRVPRVLG